MGLIKKASGKADKPQQAVETGQDDGDAQQQPEAGQDQAPDGAADAGQPDPADSGSDGASQDGSEDQGEDQEGQGGSPDEGADADDSSAQDTGQPGSPADDTGGGPAASENLNEIPAKPQQQAEYNKANQMLYQTLYQNTGAGNAVVKGIQSVRKIDSAVRLCTLLVDQIDKKTNMDQAIILPFTKDVVAHVLDIAEQVKGLQYSDDEANAVLGATLQAVMHIFGVTKQQANAFMSHMNPQEQQGALKNYHDALNKAKAATQQGGQGAQQPQPGQQQPAQPAPQAQPAGQSAGGDASQGDDESTDQQPAQQGGGMMSQAEQAGGQEQQNG